MGNVHSTIDITDKPLLQYLATYEIASANLEGMLFDGVSEIREDKPNSSDPNDVKSGRLNGTDPERRTGTSLLMHVMADDQVDISVNNFYENYDKDQDDPVNAEDMLESLVSTLTGGTGGLGGSESHNPDMVQQLFEPDNYMNAYEELVYTATDAGKPKAYLNYMLFDENMVLQKEFSKAVQVNGNGSWQTIGTNGAVTIPVNGYLAVYLSTRSQTVSCVPCSDVYFDQLSIKVQKGRLLEETHYYPHGLPMAALSSDAANNTKAQRHKYQGNEYIKDLGLNWMDFHARQYDPQLGRFLGIDPRADQGGQQTLSPYAAMGNMPESMVDPNGEQYGGALPNIIPKDYGNAGEYNGEASGTIKDMMENPMGAGGLFSGGSNNAFNAWGYGTDKMATVYFYARIESIARPTTGSTTASGSGSAAGNLDRGTKVSSGITVAEIIRNGGIIDKNDGKSITYHWFGQSNPEDISSLQRYEEVIAAATEGEEESIWSEIWNSPIVRWLVPDKLSVSIGGDFAGVVGVGAQPINFSMLTRGKEPGIYLTPTFSVNVGGGAFVSGGVTFGISQYSGNPRNITSSMLSGSTHGGMATGGALGVLSLGGSYSPTDNDNRFLNGNLGAGIGFGGFVGYQYQYVPAAVPLWQW